RPNGHHQNLQIHKTPEQLSQVKQRQESIVAPSITDPARPAFSPSPTTGRDAATDGRASLYGEEQYRLLKAAREAVGLQGQRIQSLAEAVQPHTQGDGVRLHSVGIAMQAPDAPIVTVAAGTNMLVAPVYRGSLKREKKCSCYMTYERHIRALNQGTQARIFVMPLSACIAQETITRVCETELFKSDGDGVARRYGRAMSLHDAESRISRLMHDFYAILHRLNSVDVVHDDPKKVMIYLVEALRPPAFRSAAVLTNPAGDRRKAPRTQSHRCSSKKPGAAALPSQAPRLASAALLMKTIKADITRDSGAEMTVVAPSLLNKLHRAGVWLRGHRRRADTRIEEGTRRPAFKHARRCASIAQCWVTAHALPTDAVERLLSRPVMERLGYSSTRLIENAQQQQQLYDMSDVDATDTGGMHRVLALASSADPLAPTIKEMGLVEEEMRACFPVPQERETQASEAALHQKGDEARDKGAPCGYVDHLRKLLLRNADVFRLTIGHDPPVAMPHMEIVLKPNAQPQRCRARRYSQAHREFLKEHVAERLQADLCYRNRKGRWCSPPLIAKKPRFGKFRMTVVVRGPNTCVGPVDWPMPILEVGFDRLRGSTRHFSLDFFNEEGSRDAFTTAAAPHKGQISLREPDTQDQTLLLLYRSFYRRTDGTRFSDQDGPLALPELCHK
ncbi:TPA: LOW QUALITY PROTEIN: hypothetical protein N0F65_008650, partial [Lagenidium giganteum]